MPWSVQMASTEPVALDPMARWSLESTTITVITGHRIATGESTALLVYTALVALVLMGQQSSVDPIKPLLSQRKGWSAYGSDFSP
jgi:hypothetical protein